MALNLSEPSAKKCKLSSEEVSIHEYLKDFHDLQEIEIVNNNTSRKTICIKGKFSNKDDICLILLEKTPFDKTDVLNENYFDGDSYLKKEFSNDIYGSYKYYPKSEFNGNLVLF